MSAEDILFEPLTQQAPAVLSSGDTRIIRTPGAILADIQPRMPRKTYIDLATEIMDFAVVDTQSAGLVDVRGAKAFSGGEIDLTSVVGRFHTGFDDIWISRPVHMLPSRHRFTGRFGYVRACRMPAKMRTIGYITWYYIETDEGQLPAIDLGLMVHNPSAKWWRVFTNKADAEHYFNS